MMTKSLTLSGVWGKVAKIKLLATLQLFKGVVMKKIPTLFVREYYRDNSFSITEKVTKGFEWVLEGKGTATIKIDGSCTAIINGEFYKRYDAKHGKTPPPGAIPCCDPDPKTGHWPHWLKVNPESKEDKWFNEAYNNTGGKELLDGTYEAIGPHFNNNPYELNNDVLVRHGEQVVEVERTFTGIKEYLAEHYIEGLVFWKDGAPMCKIKRKDFGFSWNINKKY